jgi:hypothetical protein
MWLIRGSGGSVWQNQFKPKNLDANEVGYHRYGWGKNIRFGAQYISCFLDFLKFTIFQGIEGGSVFGC